jgi:hypothetical protein
MITIQLLSSNADYIIGNRLSLRDLFETKKIPLHIFFSQGSGTSETRVAVGEAAPTYEGVETLSLERLRWDGLVDGSEKIDLSVSMITSLFGKITLLLSVGDCPYILSSYIHNNNRCLHSCGG